MATDGDLADLLAKVLPTGAALTVRHVSSTPAPSAALFAAAPGQDAESTFCENHFLSVSIESSEHDGAEIIVFGMEVLVYNTAHLTTIFVSKADSTGFIHLLKLPQKVSVLRLISNTFLSYLARSHQRPGVRLVVSLFARAQDQYLFPGSIENAEKHVLDDRGLIKWWCRSIDHILREKEPESVSKDSKTHETVEAAKASATAYLIVPGCDRFETRNFFPVSARADPQDQPRWLASYPLQQMCRDPLAPPRCLVPRLPDDPKTRFLIDLDDELPEPVEGENAPPSTGQWKSVKSLDQFWEMMSFRQECSAGRLVGFLWLVINPPGLMNSTTMASKATMASQAGNVSGAVTAYSIEKRSSSVENQSRRDASKSETKETAAATKVGAEATDVSTESHPEPVGSVEYSPLASSAEPQSTNAVPFHWPEAGRGNVVLSEADYKKMMDGVLDHFYDADEIVTSTKSYIDQVAALADQLTWGKRVSGTCSPQNATNEAVSTNNFLDSGLIRKRKKPEGDEEKKGANEEIVAQPSETATFESTTSQPAAVNVLSAGLVRKKKKT